MANQPRVDVLEPSEFFADGSGARPQVAGTVDREQYWEETPATTGREGDKLVQDIPLDVSADTIRHGQKLFGIICKNCHGWSGYGDGVIVQKGFPKPPSYHIDRLRAAPAGHFFRVVTEGFGRMPSYRERLEPADRWAVIAYVRALQLSQHAAVDQLTDNDRAALEQIDTNPELPGGPTE